MNRAEAKEQAKKIMERTNQTMRLENQEVGDKDKEELLQLLVEKIMENEKEKKGDLL